MADSRAPTSDVPVGTAAERIEQPFGDGVDDNRRWNVEPDRDHREDDGDRGALSHGEHRGSRPGLGALTIGERVAMGGWGGGAASWCMGVLLTGGCVCL